MNGLEFGYHSMEIAKRNLYNKYNISERRQLFHTRLHLRQHAANLCHCNTCPVIGDLKYDVSLALRRKGGYVQESNDVIYHTSVPKFQVDVDLPKKLQNWPKSSRWKDLECGR